MLNDSAQGVIIPDKYHLLDFLQEDSTETSPVSSIKFPEVVKTA
jgi:hypothetical protein